MTIDNVGREPLEVNVGAVAYAVYNLAATTEAVNGVPGTQPKGTTPDQVTLDGPQGTFAAAAASPVDTPTPRSSHHPASHALEGRSARTAALGPS